MHYKSYAVVYTKTIFGLRRQSFCDAASDPTISQSGLLICQSTPCAHPPLSCLMCVRIRPRCTTCHLAGELYASLHLKSIAIRYLFASDSHSRPVAFRCHLRTQSIITFSQPNEPILLPIYAIDPTRSDSVYRPNNNADFDTI